MNEPTVTRAGNAVLQEPHEFLVGGDASIGELFILCACDWKKTVWVRPDQRQDVTALLEEAIKEHNGSSGGALGGE